MTSQPDPKDGPRRLLWEAIQYLRSAEYGSNEMHEAINLVNRRIDELLRVVPPEGGPRPDAREKAVNDVTRLLSVSAQFHGVSGENLVPLAMDLVDAALRASGAGTRQEEENRPNE